MPYITRQERPQYESAINQISDILRSLPPDKRKGHLNYVISSILGRLNPKRYSDFNDIMGVLDCVAREFYRRKVAPYEDEAIRRNGDLDQMIRLTIQEKKRSLR